MLARIRGPSRKPVCAATKRRHPADTRVTTTSTDPAWKPPMDHAPNTRSARTAFMTLVGCGREPVSRYARMMPLAVKASETAM